MEETKKEVSNDEVEKMNLVCFWLIEQCYKTEADKMTIDQKNVVKFEDKLGDWRITVEKITH